MTGDEAWTARKDGVCALEIELVEPLEWEPIPDHDAIRLEMDAWDRPSVLRERVAGILEGLEAGDNLPGIVDRLVAEDAYGSRALAERSARNIVLGLAGQGNVEIHLPPVPDVFAGRYERVRELGRGAVGVVWLCRDLEHGDREVVVKHAWNWSGSLARRDENLREEADLMASVDHEGIVELVDRVEVDDRFHLVREFVEGHELADHVLTEGAVPRAERVRVARAVAEILDHLHERSIWLMDLSPSNLMREGTGGRIVLADLGHCRRVEADRIDLERVPGTVGYLGPEVFEAHEAYQATDVYGLGKLYAFMATAYPPDQGEGVDPVLERMREHDAREDELSFVEACMALDPRARPSAARAVDRLPG